MSIYPDESKLANLTPIFKKEDKHIVKNYRPISLFPICDKLFEKMIFNALYLYLDSNKLITEHQSGFRPRDSTTNQLLYLLNEIHEAFDDPICLEVPSVFLDISIAFVKVWHEGLLLKLKQNGVTGKLLKFFESYLSSRKQRVSLDGSFFEYSDIESSVPQGSVLGPLLFLIYMNLKSSFFTDDTISFSLVKYPLISAAELNHDLDLINKWASQWKMQFNSDPTKQATEVLVFKRKIIGVSA